MSTNLDQLYSPGSAVVDKVDSLSRNTVKNNIQDQRIPQQRITQAPTNSEHIVRLNEISYAQVASKTGNWTGETSIGVVAGKLATNNAYECLGQAVINGDRLCFSWGLIVDNNTSEAHSTTIYLTEGNEAQNTLIFRIRFQNNKFWVRRLGTSTVEISSFTLWAAKVKRV